MLVIQYFYATNFFGPVVANYILDDVGTTTSTTGIPGADRVSPGVYDIFFHQSHTLLLLLATGVIIPWLFVFGRGQSDVPISVAGFALLLSPLSITVQSSTGIGANRLIPNFEPVLTSIVGVGLLGIPTKKNRRRIAGAILLVLLAFQAFSPIVSPDHPKSYRSYLHQDEIDAKQFTYRYTDGTVTTDYWYGHERIKPLPNTYTDSGTNFKLETEGYMQKTLHRQGDSYILHRSAPENYRFHASGIWKLTWNPDEKLSQNYARTYSSGGVQLYTKQPVRKNT